MTTSVVAVDRDSVVAGVGTWLVALEVAADDDVELVATIDVGAAVTSVAYVDGYILAGTEGRGLRAIRYRGSGGMEAVDSFADAPNVADVAARPDGTVLVAGGPGGLHVVRLADGRIMPVGHLESDHPVVAVAVDESAAVIVETAPLTVVQVDLADPADIRVVDRRETESRGAPRAAALSAGVAYIVADYSGELLALTVSGAGMGPVEYIALAHSSVSGVAALGEVAAVAAISHDGSNVVEVFARVSSAPLQLQRMAGWSDPSGRRVTGYALDIVDDTLFVAYGPEVLRVLQLVDRELESVGQFDLPDVATSMSVVEERVYIGGPNPVLHVIDAANPAVPRYLDWYTWNVDINAIAFTDDRGYVAVTGGALVALTRSDTGALVESIALLLPFVDIYDIAVVEDHVLVATDSIGLLVVAGDSLEVVGQIDLGGRVLAVDGSGNYAAAAVGAKGLKVIALATPEEPQVVAEVSDVLTAIGVVWSEDVVYVAEMDVISRSHPFSPGGVRVFDMQNPEQPETLARFVREGGIARVIPARAGFVIVDFERRLEYVSMRYGSPKVAQTFPVVAANAAVSASQDVVYATGPTGVSVLRIEDELEPREVIYLPQIQR